MQLTDALIQVANQLSFDAVELLNFTLRDEIGGWPASLPPYVDWPGGSIWSVEGKFLYAITRALRPEHILECGTKWGCSTSHLLAACEANDYGQVVSVDKGVDSDIPEGGYGSRIPDALRGRWSLNCPVGAQEFIAQTTIPFTLAYEDTVHTFAETAEILSALKSHSGIQVIISHDIAHPWVGYAMRDAWAAVFGAEGKDWQAYPIEPSDCGLAVWVRH